MDNPQHYQPLSHALNPPSSSRSIYSATASSYVPQQPVAPPPPLSGPVQPEEEEEDEDDHDDEGLVEEQLSRNDPDLQGSNPTSPKISATSQTQASQAQAEDHSEHEPERKRRPGRPRGSKNRKPRAEPPKAAPNFYYQTQPTQPAPAAPTGPPQHPSITSQNQQYYEFQWRVLNLCAEFYGAAEELVKGTSPLVIAQCYQMGPSIKIDPLNMLAEAKRVCDTLLANPSQLVNNPPPPMYPVLPSIYPSLSQPQVAPAPSASTSTAGASTSQAAKPPSTAANIITNPQSFVVPLGNQPAYSQYPVYQTPAYGAPSYYPQYTYPPGTYYATPQPPVTQAAPQQAQNSSSTTPSANTAQPQAQPQATLSTAMTTTSIPGNQGAWSDEETERLKKLAEDSRSRNSAGEIEWEWVVHEWGISRTRHQILLKATSLGLKESSGRGTKRRREDGAPPEPSNVNTTTSAPGAVSQVASNNMTIPSASSPTHSSSTPAASPAIANLQRPPSAKGLGNAPPPVAGSKMPWPMPHVAVNTPSPVMSGTQTPQTQRTDYYRPRPSQGDSTSGKSGMSSQLSTHQYMYTANGQSGAGIRTKDNTR